MAIKERKQITGTTAQIDAYAGHEGQIVWDKEKKTFVGMSGIAGTNYPLASKTYVDEGLAGKAPTSHTHTVSQITDMSKVVLSVNNIPPNDSGDVPLGLHAIATSGNYNDLTNKPYIPINTSNWSASNGINGWARDNSTGFTVQWGRMTTGSRGDRRVNFPRSFSNVSAVLTSSIGYSIDTTNYSWNDSVIGFDNLGMAIRTHSEEEAYTSSWCMYCAFGFS